MRVWFSPYALRPLRPLSSRQGALLKIETIEGVGYSDLHPWPELGDEPLPEQLRLIASAQWTRLSRRSAQLAVLDRAARVAGVSAFAGREVPDSHFLVNDAETLSVATLTSLSEEGFRTLKIKLGRNQQNEIAALQKLAPELSSFRLRFDFNASLGSGQYTAFVEALPKQLRSAIEFVEDPTHLDAGEWRQLHEGTRIDLALDRSDHCEIEAVAGAFQWLVLKPAIQDPEKAERFANRFGARLCVTSYLDHPVGQVGAALEAARLSSPLGTCGLLSHRTYAPNEFSECLAQRGPRFVIPAGAGIGFAGLLDRQQWRELKS